MSYDLNLDALIDRLIDRLVEAERRNAGASSIERRQKYEAATKPKLLALWQAVDSLLKAIKAPEAYGEITKDSPWVAAMVKAHTAAADACGADDIPF